MSTAKSDDVWNTELMVMSTTKSDDVWNQEFYFLHLFVQLRGFQLVLLKVICFRERAKITLVTFFQCERPILRLDGQK